MLVFDTLWGGTVIYFLVGWGFICDLPVYLGFSHSQIVTILLFLIVMVRGGFAAGSARCNIASIGNI